MHITTHKITHYRMGKRTYYGYRLYRDGVNRNDVHIGAFVMLHHGC